MHNYRIEKFTSAHADIILNNGEKENASVEYDTKSLQCEDSWTGFYNDEPIVSGGIIELWKGVADIWLIIADNSTKHKFFLIKNIKRHLENTIAQRQYVRIQATVREDFRIGMKFAELFGMKQEGLMEKYGLDGKNYFRYVSAGSALAAGSAAKNEANYNAAIKDNQALGIEQNVQANQFLAEAEIQRMRDSFASFKGQNVVNFAGSGVDLGSGSVATIERKNLEKYLDDEYMFKFNEAKRNTADLNQAQMLKVDAQATRMRGKFARKMSYIKAGTTLLSGGSQMYSYNSLNQINPGSTGSGEIA